MNIQEYITKHEGLKLFPYLDTTGHWTIGVGRNLSEVGISFNEATLLLNNDIKKVMDGLQKSLPWFESKPDNVKTVLIDMAFNLGINGLLSFKNTLALIEQGKYKEAGDALLLSKYAKQVGIRAIENSELLKNT
jgi:lysozyme